MIRRLQFALAALVIAPAAVVLIALLPWWAGLSSLAVFVLWLCLTRTGRLIRSITAVGLATLPQRIGPASVVVVGIAGVVGVLVALLAMSEGFRSTLQETGSDDTAIVLRAGSQSEINSVIDADTSALIAEEPQVMRDGAGRPIASPELVVVASLPKRSSGHEANVQMRGVGSQAWQLRPRVRILAGRRFRPGMRELIVGKNARREFASTEIGSTLDIDNEPWTVVGEFDSADAHNSELWADTDVLAKAYRRGSTTTSVVVRLTSKRAFDVFKAAVASDPRLKVDVSTTRDYYDRQSQTLTKLIRILGTTIAAIMAVGAFLGALNTMYAAVAARTREISTLRAMGFKGGAVVASVLIETLLLAGLGGVIGALVAWALFNNFTAASMGTNFSQVVFALQVTPALLITGLKWALTIGVLGGLLPALRAAHMRVSDGLRQP